MAERKHHVEIGEESSRGTAETSTVGYIPVTAPLLPAPEFTDENDRSFRGEQTVLGNRFARRLAQKLGFTLETQLYTEAGTTAGIIGTLFKHFFGKATSAQNGSTGQYYHMFYPVPDPFATANLGDKALTVTSALSEETDYKSYIHLGNRVKAVSLDIEPGAMLKTSFEMLGQKLDTIADNAHTPVYPAENLLLKYSNCNVYTGTITRTGTAPDFSDFAFGSATLIKPDKVTIKLDNGMEDKLRVAGVDYPDKTNMGLFTATIELAFNWQTSGFDSIAAFKSWLGGIDTTNFFLHFDTGTQAGTGDNHSLYLDLPQVRRTSGAPAWDYEKDPTVTLSFEAEYNSTTQYMIGLLLKNTATSV